MTRVLTFSLVSLLSVSLTLEPSMSYAADNPTATSDHAIHDGTPVKLRLRENVSSATARTGQEVPFETVDEVMVDGVTVLPKGSSAIAVVTEAESKRSMGRAGKLNMAISYARLKDGDKVALRAVSEQKGGSHTGAMTGAMVATSLIVWPAAPFFLFMKGKDISIPQGTEITAFVDGDMHLDMAKFGAAPEAGTQGAQVSLAVDSTPAGADIEVDGNFVGSTPSAVPVAVGNHEVTVRKKGYSAWSRRMNIAGGSVHLTADLERGR
jgi:PEGA domain